MTFRSKLILLVAVPLCALVAVTVPGVTSRLAVVRAETRAQHLQAPSAALTQLVQVLDNEHALSNWYLADGDLRVFLQLKAARVQTDGAVAALRSVAGELGAAHADSAASSLGDLLLRMQRAGKTRQTVDTRVATLDSVNASYQDSVTQALNVVDTMGFSLSDANEVANLRDFATVLRLAAAAGQERAVLTAGFAQGRLPSNLLQETVGAVAAQDAYRASFEAQASSSLRGAFAARIRSGGSVSDPVRVLRADALAGRFGGTTVAAQRWYDASTKQTEVLFAAARGVLSESDHFGTGRKNTAQREMYVYGAGALGALLLALGLALLIGRSATRALRRLTNAADEVTERKLPHLLDALQTGGAPSDIPDVTPAPVESRDEIGVLARAFNKMEQAVVDVAREQTSLLRRGVSELYVNLARRNQNLLERQIRMIDA
ncbi:MAG: nitrate- and nitrite sensing domain-containing protein, partial [Actinobacteria bacterium]|nr:nitrate- and nitrite sensing domain-containing protein [Actinomycetota bacterium]